VSARLRESGELQQLQSVLSQPIRLLMSFCCIPAFGFEKTLHSLARVIEIGAKGQALDRAGAPAEAGLCANLSMFPAIPRCRAGIRWLLAAEPCDVGIHLLISSAR
jgi:hypothetical protein